MAAAAAATPSLARELVEIIGREGPVPGDTIADFLGRLTPDDISRDGVHLLNAAISVVSHHPNMVSYFIANLMGEGLDITSIKDSVLVNFMSNISAFLSANPLLVEGYDFQPIFPVVKALTNAGARVADVSLDLMHQFQKETEDRAKIAILLFEAKLSEDAAFDFKPFFIRVFANSIVSPYKDMLLEWAFKKGRVALLDIADGLGYEHAEHLKKIIVPGSSESYSGMSKFEKDYLLHLTSGLQDQARIIQALSAAGASPARADRDNWNTALHHAAINGFCGNIKALLDLGAKPEAVNIYGLTPYEVATPDAKEFFDSRRPRVATTVEAYMAVTSTWRDPPPAAGGAGMSRDA